MKLFEATIKSRANSIVKAYDKSIKKDYKILDVGCGNGVISEIIANNFNCHVTGTDILDYRITKIGFKQMEDNGQLPFKNNSFDIVMFNDVLHHMPYKTQPQLILEAMRVGEKALVFELMPTFYGKFTDWLANKIHNSNMRIPFTYRTLDSWESLFKENKINFKSNLVTRNFPQNIFQLSFGKLADLLYYPITNYCFQLSRGKLVNKK